MPEKAATMSCLHACTNKKKGEKLTPLGSKEMLNQEVMQEMLTYIYTGKATNLKKMANSLLTVADKMLCLEICLCRVLPKY